MLPTRRQKAVLEAIQDHMSETGQMPTLSEIARRCGLSSVATVHRHLSLLQERGLLKRRRSRRRGIELRPAARASAAESVPILGTFAPGRAIARTRSPASAAVPRGMVTRAAATSAVVVSGDALSGEQILDGDIIVIERRDRAADGETVVAVSAEGEAHLRLVRRERGRVRLMPMPGVAPAEATTGGELQVHSVVLGLLRRFA